MIINLLSLISLAAAASPKLFCYWESWNQFKVNDYVNTLDDVPIKTTEL
jgi:hypothetical protein